MTTKIDKTTTKNHSLTVNTGRRFRDQRKRLNLRTTDFESHGGWPASTIYGWEAGKASPKSEFLASTQDLGFDVAYILTGHLSVRTLSGPAPAPAGDSNAIYLPLLNAKGSMGQGNGFITEGVILGEVPVSRKWIALHRPGCRPDALKLVYSYCDSMGDTLRSGDFVFVDTDYRVADVSGVYVLQANSQLFIKRVTRRLDGTHEITSDNPNVRTVEVLDGTQQVRICGRVVFGWNGRRF